MLNFLKIWIPVALAATVMLSGCRDDVFREPQKENGEHVEGNHVGNMCLRLRLKVEGVHTPAETRAATGVEVISGDETPGTDMENAVKSICLFVYDSNNGVMTDHIILDKDRIAMIMSASGLVVPINTAEGQSVYVYAVVNPTERMLAQLMAGQNAKELYLYSYEEEYRDVIDEIVPGSAGHQTKLESNKSAGIPMTGIFRTVASSDSLITTGGEHPESNPLDVSVEVSRIVAKMHVVAAAKEFTLSDQSKVEYVNAEDHTSHVRENAVNSDYANWIGWIRLSDVHYIPNGMNKSTYLFPHYNNAGKPADRNMDLMSCIRGNRFDETLYDINFVYYDGMALHRTNISAPDNMAQAEALDQTRLDLTGGSNDANRYTRGMYCLENYFDTPANGDFFARYYSSIPVVTHLSIAARLTPRNIVVLKDYAAQMDKFVKMYEDTPDKFLRKYGLTAADFSDADVQRWKTVIKERYFGETTLPDIYRTDFRIVRTLTESDAADLINWSLMANSLWSDNDADFDKGKYPAATFYVYNTEYDDGTGFVDNMWTQRYLYLTAGAVNLATDENARIKTYSVPHVGGWGYYYTYLDQLGQTADGVTPYTASQVTRNRYYIVSVTNFGVPGGTITRPEYIKTNTLPVDWVYGGRSDINLH